MEGPYFSYKKRGAQNAEYLKEPDFEGFKALYEGCGGLVRIVDIAPELPGSVEFVKKAKELCTVSVAHTDSDYDHARAAYDAGATHLTHLYNAMPGIHHRNPGVIPAAVENPNVRAEIICDGLHVHPASVRLAFSMFGGERMILISDAGRCCGLQEGDHFLLGGQDAWLKGGIGRLADGTIACSATNLYDCMTRAITFGVREEDAVLLRHLLLLVEGVLLLADVIQALVAHDDRVHHVVGVVGVLILLEHRHAGLGQDGHLAGGGLQLAGEDFQEGGFTRAVGADDAVAVALGELEIHVGKEGLAAVGQAQIGNCNHVVLLMIDKNGTLPCGAHYTIDPPRGLEKKWTRPPFCGVIDCIKERKEVKSGG